MEEQGLQALRPFAWSPADAAMAALDKKLAEGKGSQVGPGRRGISLTTLQLPTTAPTQLHPQSTLLQALQLKMRQAVQAAGSKMEGQSESTSKSRLLGEERIGKKGPNSPSHTESVAPLPPHLPPPLRLPLAAEEHLCRLLLLGTAPESPAGVPSAWLALLGACLKRRGKETATNI